MNAVKTALKNALKTALKTTVKTTPTTYNIITGTYNRLMTTPKKDWTLEMKLQQAELQHQYTDYMEVGKLLKAIALRPAETASYRLITPQSEAFWETIVETGEPAHLQRYVKPEEGEAFEPYFETITIPGKEHISYRYIEAQANPDLAYYETIVETDPRPAQDALWQLRTLWMFNPVHTARQIVAVLSDFPVYCSDSKRYDTEQMKKIRRQTTRFLRTPPPAPPTPAQPKIEDLPEFLTISQNLTLLETDRDLYQRHLTNVYVTDKDGNTTGMDLPLNNQFARAMASNRTHYNAEKYNPRFEAQLTTDNPESATMRRAVRYLAGQLAQGNKVKIMTDRQAGHGMIVVRAISAALPDVLAHQVKPASKPGLSSPHIADDRDFVEADTLGPSITVPDPSLNTYFSIRRLVLGGRQGPIRFNDWFIYTSRRRPAHNTFISARQYFQLRALHLGDHEGPIPEPRRSAPADRSTIQWTQLYWLDGKAIGEKVTYLAYSMRQYTDRNGIKKHVVVYVPATLTRTTTNPKTGEVQEHIVRRSKGNWAIVEENDLRQLCKSPMPLPQYDKDGNLLKYSTYIKAPPTFWRTLPPEFRKVLTEEEALAIQKTDNLRLFHKVYQAGKLIGCQMTATAQDWRSPIRSALAVAVAKAKMSPKYRKTITHINNWEDEREHEYLHEQTPTSPRIYDPTAPRQKVYQAETGRFMETWEMLSPTDIETIDNSLSIAGARHGLDLLDGEVSLSVAAELATEGLQLKRRPKLLQVEETLDKLYQRLAESDQKKQDLRAEESKTEILALLRRHPELEADLSRRHCANWKPCKIWNLQKGYGYIHTPISQSFHLRPIIVMQNGKVLTPDEQAALPENEGRRYIAGEWLARPEEQPGTPNIWNTLQVRGHKSIYQLPRRHVGRNLRITQAVPKPMCTTQFYHA